MLLSPFPVKNPKSQWISCSTGLGGGCRSVSHVFSPCAQPEAESSLVHAGLKVEDKSVRGLMEASEHLKASAYNRHTVTSTTLRGLKSVTGSSPT